MPTLDPSGDYLRNVWSTSVYPLSERMGIPMKLPPIQPRSRPAHEAAHWARAQGRFADLHEAIFRAFFERGENIGEIEVLTALVAGLGMETQSLRQALESHKFEAGVIEDESEAVVLGVSGVPAFIADRKAALSGVQSVESLQSLIAHVRELRSARSSEHAGESK